MTDAKRASGRYFLTASMLALAAMQMPATAQDSGDPGEAARTLDEVTVTARRREESLQDVPIAVSAFSAERADELQADDLSGLQYAIPNVYLDEGDASNAVIFVRGVGQNDSLAFADPGVGVYVDDVFIARSQAAFLDLFDIGRIEVLRGPQGTLYGRNTIGGAVKFVSFEPGDELEGYLEAGGGNFSSYFARGRVSGPIAEGLLRGKIAGSVQGRDGYNTNIFTGEDDGDQLTFAGRAALYFTPRSDLTFVLSADGKFDRPDTSRSPSLATPVLGFPDPVNAPATPAIFQPPADPFTVNTNANNRSEIDAYGVSLKATWQATDALSIESISAFRGFNFDLILDTDGSPLPLLDVLVQQDQEQFTQEIRATYDGDGPFAATGGLYYFHDNDLTFSGVDNAAAAIFGFPVLAFGFSSSSLADTRQVTDSFAAFFDASYDLTDRLSLSAGLRYTTETRDSARRFEMIFNPDLSVLQDTPPFLAGVGVPGNVISGEATFDAFTPRFSVSYTLADGINSYVSASRGFKSGGFDGRANNDFGFEPFDPEFVWSYEAGLKTSFHGGRLVANAAYFYNDYSDVQVTSFGADPVTGVFVSQFTNAAAATIQGIELEVFALPTDELSLSASFGFLDAEYDRFDTLVGGIATDVSGRRLVNAPRWNASLGATYERPVSNRLVAVAHLDAAYRDVVAVEVTDSPNLEQGSYILGNAFVAVKTADNRYEVRAGVQNLSDEAIRVQGFNLSAFPGVETGFFAAPRTWDIRAIVRF